MAVKATQGEVKPTEKQATQGEVKPTEPKVEDVIDKDYKEFYVNEASCSVVGDVSFQFTFTNISSKPFEKPGTVPTMIRTRKVKLIMTPNGLRAISDLLKGYADKLVKIEPPKQFNANTTDFDKAYS